MDNTTSVKHSHPQRLMFGSLNVPYKFHLQVQTKACCTPSKNKHTLSLFFLPIFLFNIKKKTSRHQREQGSCESTTSDWENRQRGGGSKRRMEIRGVTPTAAKTTCPPHRVFFLSLPPLFHLFLPFFFLSLLLCLRRFLWIKSDLSREHSNLSITRPAYACVKVNVSRAMT